MRRTGSAEEAWQPDANREVEPNDDVRGPEYEVAELVPVGAVDHPTVRRHDRFDLGAQLVVWRLDPARSMDEGV